MFMGAPLLIILANIFPKLAEGIYGLPAKFDKQKVKTKKDTSLKTPETHPIFNATNKAHDMQKIDDLSQYIKPVIDWTPEDKKCGIYCILNLATHTVYIGQAIDVDLKIKRHFSLLYYKKHPNKQFQMDYNTFEGNIQAVYRSVMILDIPYTTYGETKPWLIEEFNKRVQDYHQSGFIIHNFEDAIFESHEKAMALEFDEKNKEFKHNTKKYLSVGANHNEFLR